MTSEISSPADMAWPRVRPEELEVVLPVPDKLPEVADCERCVVTSSVRLPQDLADQIYGRGSKVVLEVLATPQSYLREAGTEQLQRWFLHMAAALFNQLPEIEGGGGPMLKVFGDLGIVEVSVIVESRVLRKELQL